VCGGSGSAHTFRRPRKILAALGCIPGGSASPDRSRSLSVEALHPIELIVVHPIILHDR
jgi:hypothetical protein